MQHTRHEKLITE